MSDVLKLRTLAEVEEEAAAWVWRLDDDAASGRDRAEFEHWLRQDPRHRAAFEELGGVWHSLNDLAEAKREERVATFVAEEQRLRVAHGTAPRRARLRRSAQWTIAATLVVAVGFVSWLQQSTEAQTLATAVGQHRSVALADGSMVRLNTNTILDTHFDRKQREIHLQKGEALFEVARNAQRPFIVTAGDTRVRAIGTAFNVRIHDGGAVEVVVTEGTVEVLPVALPEANPTPAAQTVAAGAPRDSRELKAGERFHPEAPRRVDMLSAVSLSNALAWREGAIVFDGEPLAKALEELNRYADTRLVVADEAIHDMRIGGRFRTGDVDGFIEALTRTFPVTARRASDKLIYIEAQHAGPASVQ